MGVLLLSFQLASSSSMILYGLGVGTANNNIGMVAPPLSRKILALYGKGGGERGTLYQILILVPTSMNDAKDVANNPSSSDDKDPLVKSVSDHKKKCICIQCGLPETAQTDSFQNGIMTSLHQTFLRRISTTLSVRMLLSRRMQQDRTMRRMFNCTQN